MSAGVQSVASLQNGGLSHDGGGPFVFRGVNLTLERGAFVCPLGPSGVGKSTLFRVLVGLVPPTARQTGGTASAPGGTGVPPVLCLIQP